MTTRMKNICYTPEKNVETIFHRYESIFIRFRTGRRTRAENKVEYFASCETGYDSGDLREKELERTRIAGTRLQLRRS